MRHGSRQKASSKFQIELVSEHGYPLADMLGLHLQIFLIIKSNIHVKTPCVFASGLPDAAGCAVLLFEFSLPASGHRYCY
ncbi:MAG: hypothetical protein ACLRPR_05505 [Eisenbergiella sp.]